MTVISLDSKRRPGPKTLVDRLCNLVEYDYQSGPFLSARFVDGSVKISVGGLEVWVSTKDAEKFANAIKREVKKGK